jgi:leukotriene-A4 hydrolase
MYGKAVFDFNAIGGLMELKETVQRLGAGHPHTVLQPALAAGEDPDDAFSKVPYEKGFAFLVYLEQMTAGGADAAAGAAPSAVPDAAAGTEAGAYPRSLFSST